jgi:hypothetical protein
MKKTIRCTECHFFKNRWSYVHIVIGSPAEPIDEWLIVSSEFRKKLKNLSPNEIGAKGIYQFGCYFEVWSNIPIEKKEEIDRLALFERPVNSCFFFPYTINMSFVGAEILQKREEDRTALKDSIDRSNKAYRLTFWALIVAIGALLINLQPLFAKLYKLVRQATF